MTPPTTDRHCPLDRSRHRSWETASEATTNEQPSKTDPTVVALSASTLAAASSAENVGLAGGGRRVLATDRRNALTNSSDVCVGYCETPPAGWLSSRASIMEGGISTSNAVGDMEGSTRRRMRGMRRWISTGPKAIKRSSSDNHGLVAR